MAAYCTESCYYNDCGTCTKGYCPRFAAEIENLEEEEEEDEKAD